MAKKQEFTCPFCQMLSEFVHSETGEHLANAKREVLMAVTNASRDVLTAMKSLIEAKIEYLDKIQAKSMKAKKVEVE